MWAVRDVVYIPPDYENEHTLKPFCHQVTKRGSLNVRTHALYTALLRLLMDHRRGCATHNWRVLSVHNNQEFVNSFSLDGSDCSSLVPVILQRLMVTSVHHFWSVYTYTKQSVGSIQSVRGCHGWFVPPPLVCICLTNAIRMNGVVRTCWSPLVGNVKVVCTCLSTADQYEPTRTDINRSDLWKFLATCRRLWFREIRLARAVQFLRGLYSWSVGAVQLVHGCNY